MLSISLKNIVENIKQPKNPAEVVRNNTDKIISSEQAYNVLNVLRGAEVRNLTEKNKSYFSSNPQRISEYEITAAKPTIYTKTSTGTLHRRPTEQSFATTTAYNTDRKITKDLPAEKQKI